MMFTTSLSTQGTSRYYFLKDHPSVDGQVSGSVRTTVDFTNTALGYDPDFLRGRLYPFGIRRGGMQGRSSSTSTPDDDYPDFIGMGHTLSAHWRKRDAELDLDYSSPERSRRVLARNYDPLIGRFMQVDPLAMDYPSLTPYGYVLNNPLTFTDPTGEYPTCGDNCDEFYRVGSVVENQYGSWTYAGKNQWKDINGNTVSGTDLVVSLNQMIDGGFISQSERSWADRWSESSNIFATMSYDLLNSPWLAFQVLNPFDKTVTHINGALATQREQLDAGVASAPIGYGIGKTVQSVRFMRYPNAGGAGINVYKKGQRVFGVDWHRFKLNGQTVNRPHYHRGVTKSQMKKHRPWQGGW